MGPLTKFSVSLHLVVALYVLWFLSSKPLLRYQQTATYMAKAKDELGLTLEAAAMANQTLIITVINKAYTEQSVEANTTMLDLFLDSFWLGEDTSSLLDYLLIVAMDQTAYDHCMFKRLHCYRLVTKGVNFGGEKVYMSEEFILMMWRRTLFLLDVLKRGYSFIFTDTDVIWLRNPFPKLSSEELQLSVDRFIGDPAPEHNPINTGFYYIKSNNKTISLFETWYKQKDNSTGKKEQDVLVDLIQNGLFRQLDLHAKFLETKYFSGFCQDSGDVSAVATVHANCCRHISAKVRDLIAVLRDWKRFKAVMTESSESFKWSPHVGCKNSWKTPAGG